MPPSVVQTHKTAYYYNEVTGASQWEKPEMMAWVKVPVDAKEM